MLKKKSYPSRRIFKATFVVGLVCLFIIVLIFLVGQIRSSRLLSPLTRPIIVFRTSPEVILLLPKTEEKVVLVTLPDTIYVDVPFGYGSYRLEAVWPLSQLEDRPGLLSETISDLLGVKVTAQIVGETPLVLPEKADEILTSVKQNYSFFEVFRRSYASDLNTLDQLLFAWKLGRLRPSDTRIFLTHGNERLFESTILPDGEEVKKINFSAFDSFLERTFEERQIRSDGLSVEVLNTTDTAGVGNLMARNVSTIGGKVIKIGNEDREVKSCLVILKTDLRDKLLVKYLEKAYGCSLELHDDSTRVDATILVGESFSFRWGKEIN